MLEFCFIERTMRGSIRSAYDATGRRKYLTRLEGKRFLNDIRALPCSERLFSLTLFYTGCRISEALNLKISDIDAKSGVLLITTLKKRGRIVVRRVPVPKSLAKELKAVAAHSDGRIWKFSRSTGWRSVKTAMKRGGIEGIHATAKGLRHGFGVRCALKQIPVTLIQKWMGHSDLGTTAIYLAVKDDEERELIQKTWN